MTFFSGVEKKLKAIDCADDNKAIQKLEYLMKIFDRRSKYEGGLYHELNSKSNNSDNVINTELPQPPKEYDSELELVCWMDIL